MDDDSVLWIIVPIMIIAILVALAFTIPLVCRRYCFKCMDDIMCKDCCAGTVFCMETCRMCKECGCGCEVKEDYPKVQDPDQVQWVPIVQPLPKQQIYYPSANPQHSHHIDHTQYQHHFPIEKPHKTKKILAHYSTEPEPSDQRKYNPPQQQYDPPQQRYDHRQRQYDLPQQQYDPPQQPYDPPQQQYDPPQRQYDPPHQRYNPSQRQHDLPEHYSVPAKNPAKYKSPKANEHRKKKTVTAHSEMHQMKLTQL